MMVNETEQTLKQAIEIPYYKRTPKTKTTNTVPGIIFLIKSENIIYYIVTYIRLTFFLKLEDTARYAGLLLGPVEGFGLRSLLCCCGQIWAIFGVQ